MNTILQTLFSPAKAFQTLKQENKFPGMALIILLVLVAINLILMIPVTSKITTMMMSSMPLPEERREIAIQVAHKMRYLQVIGGLFSIAVMLFLYSLLLFILTAIAKPVLDYVKSLTLVVYSYFAVMIGELINTALLYFRGLEEIKSPFEIMLTGVNMFTSVEKAGAPFYTFLSMINPFQIWFVILLSIGLKVFTGMKYRKVWILVMLFWLILVLFSVASVWFSQTAMKKAGIM